MVDLHHLVHHPVIENAGRNRKHQLARIKLCHAVLQLLLRPVNGPENPRIGGKWLLQRRFHIGKKHQGRMHIHHVDIGMLRRLLRTHKALPYHGGGHPVAADAALRIEHGVVAAVSEGIHDELRQKKLLCVVDLRPLARIESGNQQHVSRGPGPDHVADADVPENAVQLLRRQILESGSWRMASL